MQYTSLAFQMVFTCNKCQGKFSEQGVFTFHVKTCNFSSSVVAKNRSSGANPPSISSHQKGQIVANGQHAMVPVASNAQGFEQTMTVFRKTYQVPQEVVPVETTKVETQNVDIMILIDQSGSMSGIRSQAVARHLSDFVLGNNVQMKDHINVLGFTTSVKELLPPTRKESISAGTLSNLGITDCDGGTRLWSAMEHCIQTRKTFIDAKKEKAKGGKRPYQPKPTILLVLTDGEDSSSNASLKEKLKHPGIPHFHVQLIHLGMASDATAMQSLSEGCGHINFLSIDPGSSKETTVKVIEDVFRTHFVKTVRHVRQQATVVCVEEVVTKVRSIEVSSHHPHSHHHHSHAHHSHHQGMMPNPVPNTRPLLTANSHSPLDYGSSSHLLKPSAPPSLSRAPYRGSNSAMPKECRVCHGIFSSLSEHLKQFPEHKSS
jgi:Mg-chelatase subunit ChlD